ncbi:MAG: putative DNA-binding domain-containing protein [Gammaproteobacteria bacterium]|nr:MAG: putative DNA-binding domain-containing protein [Gammaproteobacteria bacterium]
MNTHNTADRPAFVRQQYAFAAHIRNPERSPCPEGIEERRMKIYRELFYNNVEGFITSTYPVLRKIMPDEEWHAMIRDYFANHVSHTPLFPEMPREFLKYLEHEREPQLDDPPFLLELAHYEWVELALSLLDEKIDKAKIDSQGDLLDGIPVISPLAWSLCYDFPVHKISPDFQPKEADAKQTHLIVYRDAAFEVRFIEINPVTARLLQLLSCDAPVAGRLALQQIAVELNHPQPETVIQSGMEILNDLQRRQVILGIYV